MFPILPQPYSVKTDFFRLKSCPINVPILLFAFCSGNWNKWLYDGSCSLTHFNCKISLVHYHHGICTHVNFNQASKQVSNKLFLASEKVLVSLPPTLLIILIVSLFHSCL